MSQWVEKQKPSKARVSTAMEGLQKLRPCRERLTLGELEALTCARLTGLLTLTTTGVTLHVAFLLKRHTKFLVHFLKCTGDTETNSTSLAIETAALRLHCDVDLICHLDCCERGNRCTAKIFGLEVIFRALAVYEDLTRAASQADTCGGSLATADGDKCLFCSCCAHDIKNSGLNQP